MTVLVVPKRNQEDKSCRTVRSASLIGVPEPTTLDYGKTDIKHTPSRLGKVYSRIEVEVRGVKIPD